MNKFMRQLLTTVMRKLLYSRGFPRKPHRRIIAILQITISKIISVTIVEEFPERI